MKRSTFIKIASTSSGTDKDILDADTDSIDERQNYLIVHEARLSESRTMRLLAWMVVNFVHLVSERAEDAWVCLLTHKPINKWLTPSDLALTHLFLEHGVNQWKRAARSEIASGRRLNSEEMTNLKGLKHKEGVAGREAKFRFNSLLLYFFTNFYSRSNRWAMENMKRLQEEVNKLVEIRKQEVKSERKDSNKLNGKEDNETSEETAVQEGPYRPAFEPEAAGHTECSEAAVIEGIMHRVFYHVHL